MTANDAPAPTPEPRPIYVAHWFDAADKMFRVAGVYENEADADRRVEELRNGSVQRLTLNESVQFTHEAGTPETPSACPTCGSSSKASLSQPCSPMKGLSGRADKWHEVGETPSTAHLYVPKAQYDAKVAKMNAEAAALRSKLSTAERELQDARDELNGRKLYQAWKATEAELARTKEALRELYDWADTSTLPDSVCETVKAALRTGGKPE